NRSTQWGGVADRRGTRRINGTRTYGRGRISTWEIFECADDPEPYSSEGAGCPRDVETSSSRCVAGAGPPCGARPGAWQGAQWPRPVGIVIDEASVGGAGRERERQRADVSGSGGLSGSVMEWPASQATGCRE